MISCDSCGASIVMGARKFRGQNYCGEECLSDGRMSLIVGGAIGEDPVNAAQRIHEGKCPLCEGSGPVDLHTSYRIASFLILTSRKNRRQISCRSCAGKKKAGDLFYCLFLGWWGIPWGLIFTPIYLCRNLFGIISGPDPAKPSVELQQLVEEMKVAIPTHRAAPGPG